MATSKGFVPLVTVVDFHHARGPEVERWFGTVEGLDPTAEYGWELLPFMALSDGAHASTEDFSYFTLLRPAKGFLRATSLFGISCTTQMDASLLHSRPAEVTRSTVQKAVVVISDCPQFFGMLRQRLSIITGAWFAQRDFTDMDILEKFQESLRAEHERGWMGEDDRDQNLGMSLRSLVREFKWQTLVLLKCCLLQPKMLFFGSRCERICMVQFALISLIPGLISNLQDCAGVELDSYERSLVRPEGVRTSDRTSLLAYMGVPLQIFGKGSLFGPYTPLQQLDTLADVGTKSYMVGSTNSLLLQQRDRYSDILINLDEDTINITSPSLRSALSLSAADRRWMDYLTQSVNEGWDDSNPSHPSHRGYVGSEEFIRSQFEEYLLSLLSSVKCQEELLRHPGVPVPGVEGDPTYDFNHEWVEAWRKSENYRIWNSKTERNLFDFVEAKHPCAGGLTIQDLTQRVSQQVAELHLDERLEDAKVVVSAKLAAGREGANRMLNKLYADLEAMKEAQRKKAEENKVNAERLEREKKAIAEQLEKEGHSTPTSPTLTSESSKAGAVVASAGSKASTYVSGWGSWIGEKRRSGWGRASPSPSLQQDSQLRDVTSREDLKRESASTLGSLHPIATSPTIEETAGTNESYTESVFDAEQHGEKLWSDAQADHKHGDVGEPTAQKVADNVAEEEAAKAKAAFNPF